MNITECGHLPDIMDIEPHSLTSKSPGDLRGPHEVRDLMVPQSSGVFLIYNSKDQLLSLLERVMVLSGTCPSRVRCTLRSCL